MTTTRALLAFATLTLLVSPRVEAAPTPPDDVRAAAQYASREWGVSERDMLEVAWCESRYDPNARSRGNHLGLWQHSSRYWAGRVRDFNAQARAAGLPEMAGVWRAPIDNARITARMVRAGGWRPWTCKP